VSQPTLVIHCRDEARVPNASGRELAADAGVPRKRRRGQTMLRSAFRLRASAFRSFNERSLHHTSSAAAAAQWNARGTRVEDASEFVPSRLQFLN
jgi:hypothetical protein